MLLSIVIISWNSLPRLRECLAPLRTMLGRDDVELVWVDNGSSDGSAQWMAEQYPDATVRLLPRNMGVAFARNRGVEAAAGEFILFLDDDTIPTTEAIGRMLDYMRAHPKAGICGVALVDADGHLQDSFKSYPGIGVKAGNMLRSMLRISRPVIRPPRMMEVDYIIGACQMIRRRVFETVGLLDENIFYGPEDADFCIRARQAGFTVTYHPGCEIVHHWRRSTSASPLSPLGRRHIRALLYFYRKHRRYW